MTRKKISDVAEPIEPDPTVPHLPPQPPVPIVPDPPPVLGNVVLETADGTRYEYDVRNLEWDRPREITAHGLTFHQSEIGPDGRWIYRAAFGRSN